MYAFVMNLCFRAKQMQTKATLLAVLVVALAGTLVNGQITDPTEEPKIPCSDEVSALCPEIDGETPEYFANPDDCSKFCVCDDQVAYEKECQPGLVFDDTINVCNWPFNVSTFVLIPCVGSQILMFLFLSISTLLILFDNHAPKLCNMFTGS